MAPSGIKDVAQRAGVSVGTVSNVLNRPEMVSESTRLRVQAAIDALGFVRNEAARHLRAGQSRTIAYVLLDAGNPFFTDVAKGVEDVAREHGLAVFLCNSDQDARREEDHLDLLLEQRVRGVLITAVDQSSGRLATMPSLGVPVVLVDSPGAGEELKHCSVGVDDLEGGDLAVTHLIERGDRGIAFVGTSTIPQARSRLEGARRALERAGQPPEILPVLETVALNVAEGQRAGQRLLGMPARRRPTAVFCANDLLALGLLQEMTRQGVAVPDELAIVGYDDIEFASAAAVPLTSVRQPRKELGRCAAELLLKETQEGTAHRHRSIQFTAELVVRASSSGSRAE
ncbi:MAG TPA: LacI family DNA-binding transcriptional regulator [Actinocrinis sp.]|nr:LacI family DNA-binding transcriptional regulator [Actinocrinis sp.]